MPRINGHHYSMKKKMCQDEFEKKRTRTVVLRPLIRHWRRPAGNLHRYAFTMTESLFEFRRAEPNKKPPVMGGRARWTRTVFRPLHCAHRAPRPENLHRCAFTMTESLFEFRRAEPNKKPPVKGGFLFGGAYWTRTSDPIDVNDVLYQLSQSTGNKMYYSIAGVECQPFIFAFFVWDLSETH